MKNAFKFCMKAYFGGCFGCLGALSFLLVLAIIFTLVLGPSIMNGISSFVQSISGIFNQGASFLGSGNANTPLDMENLPVMEVFLTQGENPDSTHIETFKTADYKQIRFWVRAPEGTSLDFTLLLTLPDQSQVQFGPTFQTDPSGNPVSCGQFGDWSPQPGKYKLEVQLTSASVTVGEMEFEVTN
jgi:hypothetical protein